MFSHDLSMTFSELFLGVKFNYIFFRKRRKPAKLNKVLFKAVVKSSQKWFRC